MWSASLGVVFSAPTVLLAENPRVLSEAGLSGLTLGRPLAAVKASQLIGHITIGCEVSHPRPLVAPLRAPLTGFAEFSAKSRRLTSLFVTKGVVTNRGIRIGDTAAKVRGAYPHTRVEHSGPRNPLVYDAIVATSRGHDRIWFLLDKRGGRVRSFNLPTLNTCE